MDWTTPTVGCPKRPDGEKVGRQDGRTGEEHMPRFVKLATLSELAPGSAREVEFEGRVYALYNIDGVISAIDGICPHQGGPLAEGTVEGTTVTCPWHGWEIDVRSGKTQLGAKITQAVYDVKVEGQDVLVAVP
jgi:nitrite reductase/ring-hydroxylating ferredoxin subunit